MLDPDLGIDETVPVRIGVGTVKEAIAGTGGDKKLAEALSVTAAEVHTEWAYWSNFWAERAEKLNGGNNNGSEDC